MENRANAREKENSETKCEGISMELLGEIKEQTKRWFMAFLIMVIVEALTIGGFLWYLSQYDFKSTIEQTGVYTLIDSEGNIISSDIGPDQIEDIMEIINNGKRQGDTEQNQEKGEQ